MKIIHDFSQFPKNEKAAVFTIGFFDGVHLGHQYLLNKLKKRAKDKDSTQIVFTFSNHPSTITKPKQPISLITSIDHKIHLLEEQKIDYLILYPFTKEFSEQSPEQFIDSLFQFIPIKAFVLGHDTRVGKDRQGDQAAIQTIAKKKNCSIEYCDEYRIDGSSVSSSRVRTSILDGNFALAEKLLGRPYSILLPVVKGRGFGKKLGFSTANLDVRGLCTPPLGVYSAWLKVKGKLLKAIVNLGIAPTIKQSPFPELEVHVFDQELELQGEEVEVFFSQFIRNEKKFPNFEALKTQIAKDIKVAKTQLSKTSIDHR